jgi:hypothetical protein
VAPVLVISIGGTSPASSITIHVDNRRVRHLGPVALPYVFTDTRLDDIDGAYPVTVQAQDGSASPDARIACQIVESGADVAREARMGLRSVAWCSDHQPEDPVHAVATSGRSLSQRQ